MMAPTPGCGSSWQSRRCVRSPPGPIPLQIAVDSRAGGHPERLVCAGLQPLAGPLSNRWSCPEADPHRSRPEPPSRVDNRPSPTPEPPAAKARTAVRSTIPSPPADSASPISSPRTASTRLRSSRRNSSSSPIVPACAAPRISSTTPGSTPRATDASTR
jgi:hypothetical protein